MSLWQSLFPSCVLQWQYLVSCEWVLAGVFCGRYRVVMISMCFFIVLLCGAAALALGSSDSLQLNCAHLESVFLIMLLFGLSLSDNVYKSYSDWS